MKFNKWTLGLAAVGAVSMASAVRADEAKLSQLNTAVSSTVISGYVDVAAQYNLGNPGKTYAVNQPSTLSNSKVDNFSVNNVTISLDKALDESPWASGYHIDLNTGTDSIQAIWGLRQGYVTVRTPVGNGIDWKVGLFDGVTGYEVNTGYANPNYTRSYGYAVNPASEAGVIGSYKIVDNVVFQAGMANRGNGNVAGLSSHDYIAALALTAPESFGALKGSVLNFGTVQTFDNGGINNYSVNATINTPVTGLKLGLSYDKVEDLRYEAGDGNIYGIYATYQATEKLGFNLRGEYVDGQNFDYFYGRNGKGEEITATVEYDLWANVVSRLEFRWDHCEAGREFNANYTESAYLVALNLVYKF
jgi:hypothetical protein